MAHVLLYGHALYVLSRRHYCPRFYFVKDRGAFKSAAL
jgi:hypothetical protein